MLKASPVASITGHSMYWPFGESLLQPPGPLTGVSTLKVSRNLSGVRASEVVTKNSRRRGILGGSCIGMNKCVLPHAFWASDRW